MSSSRVEIRSDVVQGLHLDRSYSLLTVRNCNLVYQYFKFLDIHDQHRLNDIQFKSLLSIIIEGWTKAELTKLYELLDYNNKGYIEFAEFYFIFCVLVALKDGQIREFIHRHAKVVFDLLDMDASGYLTLEEFKNYSFLFDLSDNAAEIFCEYDFTGNDQLDCREFKFFCMECMDQQEQYERMKKERTDIMREQHDMYQDRWWYVARKLLKEYWPTISFFIKAVFWLSLTYFVGRYFNPQLTDWIMIAVVVLSLCYWMINFCLPYICAPVVEED